jgi:hypothetical protein
VATSGALGKCQETLAFVTDKTGNSLPPWGCAVSRTAQGHVQSWSPLGGVDRLAPKQGMDVLGQAGLLDQLCQCMEYLGIDPLVGEIQLKPRTANAPIEFAAGS